MFQRHDLADNIVIYQGDNMDVLPTIPDNHFDSIVTDPPSGIGFMGADWDSHSKYEPRTEKGKAVLAGAQLMGLEPWEAGFVAFTADWATEAYRTLKPGAHALVWALPRTSDLTAMGLRAVGFEDRSVITHLFGQGYPKNLDVSKAIDSLLGAERPIVGTREQRNPYAGADGRTFKDAPDYGDQPEVITAPGSPEAQQWEGWGTALRPAAEHWILVRKPVSEETVAANVLKHGTGAINIDACRIPRSEALTGGGGKGGWPPNAVFTHHPDCVCLGLQEVKSNSHHPKRRGKGGNGTAGHKGQESLEERRPGQETVEAWRCVENCPVRMLDEQTGVLRSGARKAGVRKGMGYHGAGGDGGPEIEASAGGASRFFPTFTWEPVDIEAMLFVYAAKASRSERNAGCEHLPKRAIHWSSGDEDPGSFQSEGTDKEANNFHPAVKSLKLLRWLLRLVTRPGGLVGDFFLGSGSTAKACALEGLGCVGIERDPDYVKIAIARLTNEQLRFSFV